MASKRQVQVGTVRIGARAPMSIQSMLSVPASDIAGSVAQANELSAAGCEIIRAAVPDRASVPLIAALKEQCDRPIVADIHYDYRIALECVAAGVDKIRINPGNIGDRQRVKAVADACARVGIPIRIGVNSGSVEPRLLERYGGATPEALVESALYHASLLEQADFGDIVLSMKSSDVPSTYAAYCLAAERCDYPLHVGVTEAGTQRMGTLKSAAGIGGLLLRGIGDTIRVSLTADPVREVETALDLLRAIGLRQSGITVVSCPTCGRTRIDLIGLTGRVEQKLKNLVPPRPIKVAVMGCPVNGPGEARDADVGIAGGDGCGLLFKKGQVIRKVPEEGLLDALLDEIHTLL